jgi:hypothetical protein
MPIHIPGGTLIVHATGEGLVRLQKVKDAQAVISNQALAVNAGLSGCHAPLFRSRKRIIRNGFYTRNSTSGASAADETFRTLTLQSHAFQPSASAFWSVLVSSMVSSPIGHESESLILPCLGSGSPSF